MKVELTQEEINSLLLIIAQAQIRGRDAEIIIRLETALKNPIQEEKK